MKRIFRTGIIALVLAHLISPLSANEKLPIFDETMQFQAIWQGFNVGNAILKSTTKDPSGHVKIFAKVSTFEMLQKIYYISGQFGAFYDYKSRSPVSAFEVAYQGKRFMKRNFRFSGPSVNIVRLERTFTEPSFPHDGPVVKEKNYNQTLNTDGYVDLLAGFYQIRSEKAQPKVGDVRIMKVLPAGQRKNLVMKILKKTEIDTAVFGRTKVMLVHTALADTDNKVATGGNLFFETKSNIFMYVTDDDKFIPVHIWTEIEQIGRVDVKLSGYVNNSN